MLYQKLLLKARYVQLNLAKQLGLPFSSRSKGKVQIIIYHGICPSEPTKYNSRHLSVDTFEQHLVFYQEHTNILSWSDWRNQQIDPSKTNVLLTFDDGLENNYQHAYPLLQKHQIPAVFAITTGGRKMLWNDLLDLAKLEYPNSKIRWSNRDFYFGKDADLLKNQLYQASTEELLCFYQDAVNIEHQIRSNKKLEPFWKLMDLQTLHLLDQEALVTLAPHSSYHQNLVHLSEEDLRQEANRSTQYMDQFKNAAKKSYFLPYGNWNARVVDTLRQAGYEEIFAVLLDEKSINEHPSLKPRFGINPYISVPLQMRYMNRGTYY